MNITFPVIELLDRYAIARVKWQKTNGSNPAELEFYQTQIDQLPADQIGNGIKALEEIHTHIWALESELKSDRERELALEEIGRRALVIRDWNRKRIEVKNSIADIINKDAVREIKKDHLSE
jgi:hypothetical protein